MRQSRSRFFCPASSLTFCPRVLAKSCSITNNNHAIETPATPDPFRDPSAPSPSVARLQASGCAQSCDASLSRMRRPIRPEFPAALRGAAPPPPLFMTTPNACVSTRPHRDASSSTIRWIELGMALVRHPSFRTGRADSASGSPVDGLWLRESALRAVSKAARSVRPYCPVLCSRLIALRHSPCGHSLRLFSAGPSSVLPSPCPPLAPRSLTDA